MFESALYCLVAFHGLLLLVVVECCCICSEISLRNIPLSKRRLHCTFIDFRKVFGSVCWNALWDKIVKQNENDKVLQVIMIMYQNIKPCVFHNGEMSDSCLFNLRETK